MDEHKIEIIRRCAESNGPCCECKQQGWCGLWEDALMRKRLTRWEGRDEDGPRAVLVRRDNFNAAMQEALRKLARLEDAEEAARPIERDPPGANTP